MEEILSVNLSNEKVLNKLRMLREAGVDITELIKAALLDYKISHNLMETNLHF